MAAAHEAGEDFQDAANDTARYESNDAAPYKYQEDQVVFIENKQGNQVPFVVGNSDKRWVRTEKNDDGSEKVSHEYLLRPARTADLRRHFGQDDISEYNYLLSRARRMPSKLISEDDILPTFTDKKQEVNQNERGQFISYEEEEEQEEAGEFSEADREYFSEKSREFFLQAAREFEKINIADAARCYRAAGDEEQFQRLMGQSATNYESEGDFEVAALLFKEIGDQAKYEAMMNKAAEAKANPDTFGGGFDRAAAYYEEAGNLEKANEMHLRQAQQYEKYEDYTFAAREYEIAGDQEAAMISSQRAIQELESNPPPGIAYLEQLGESYLKIGNSEKAREAYVKFAEGLYEGNNLRRAAEVYAMLGEEQKAQELAEEEARRYEDSLDRGSYGVPLVIMKLSHKLTNVLVIQSYQIGIVSLRRNLKQGIGTIRRLLLNHSANFTGL